jgi:hypothetical protein
VRCGTPAGSPRLIGGAERFAYRDMGEFGRGVCREFGDDPMRSMWSVRVAAVAFSLGAASLVSFPSYSTTGAGLTSTPASSVNHALKGDRLPTANPTAWQHELRPPVAPLQSQSRARVPLGCDNAFSPVSSPGLANVFRRCLV